VQRHLDDVAARVVLVDLFAGERAAGGEEVRVVNAVALLVVGRRLQNLARALDGLAVLDGDLGRLGSDAADGAGQPVLLALVRRRAERGARGAEAEGGGRVDGRGRAGGVGE
jgi:hypothetical protein